MTEAPLGSRRTPRQRALALAALLLLLAVPLVAWDRMVRMPQASHLGQLPAATDDQIALAGALRRDVEYLATTLGERNLRRHSVLERSANWIQSRLETAGYTARRQTFLVEGKPCHNLEVQITGTQHPDQIVVVGAHYDSAPGTPGANDNGSGVASLLALAGRLKGLQTARTVRLVWFTNEEPPHFQTPAMGSLRYASRSRQRGEQIVAMLSLETMGYFSERAGSQKYPGPLQALYPHAGNFVAFVGDLGSRELVHRVASAFRKQTPFPSEGAALPALLPGVSWSDHWSFWQQGYPALMVTDTAPFRYPHYHEPEDTPDKLDYQRLARVVEGLDRVVRSLGMDLHH
ncbi:MAG: M28 family peptidase [Myxococcales bacterium]|nr:M28 family peptidase [Myxococcales bacterium]